MSCSWKSRSDLLHSCWRNQSGSAAQQVLPQSWPRNSPVVGEAHGGDLEQVSPKPTWPPFSRLLKPVRGPGEDFTECMESTSQGLAHRNHSVAVRSNYAPGQAWNTLLRNRQRLLLTSSKAWLCLEGRDGVGVIFIVRHGFNKLPKDVSSAVIGPPYHRITSCNQIKGIRSRAYQTALNTFFPVRSLKCTVHHPRAEDWSPAASSFYP